MTTNMLLFLWIFIYHVHKIMSMDCEYSAREYQVTLRPDLLINSFETGVMRILDILTSIEDAGTIPFKVSRSSLKFKNISLVLYALDNSSHSDDFNTLLRFKSRRKKPTEPADIVMKISNADPALSCVPLTVSEDYINMTKIKFELDIHGENGRLRPQCAHSFTTDLSMDFNQASSVNLSSILIDVAAKVSGSQQPLIIIPDSFGKITLQTAEFNINLAGQKLEAVIEYYRRISMIKAEFSFRVKGTTVAREVLVASQRLIIQLSQMPTIALFALMQPRND